MRQHSRKPRGGFASVIAVALIGLVAVALATMASLFAVEMRRTVRHTADVQVRQLLTAGAFAAPANVGDGVTERSVKVALPEDLSTAGATLELHVRPHDGHDEVTVLVRVDAKLDEVRRSQLLTFCRDGSRWELVSAVLDGE